MNIKIGVFGTSIWQQNMPLLERLTIDRDTRQSILGELKSLLDLNELIYLATCNRVEFIYAISGKYHGDRLLHRLIDFFFASGRDINFSPNDLFHYQDREAIAHIFRTCSSLESLVIGENQITGQFKQAYQDAIDAGLAGQNLDCLAREALAVARKVKSQTEIGNGSVSMASLAFGELKKGLGDTKSPRLALVGTGKMPEKIARYCLDTYACQLIFVNRTLAKAEELAKRFSGTALALDDFKSQPVPVDAIISATASNEPIFDLLFRQRLTAVSSRVICIDLAVPQDFCREFAEDDRLTVIDIPALRELSQGSLRNKFIQAGKANEIVREAVDNFLSGRIEISLKPIFKDCYEESIELARNRLEELFSDRLSSLSNDQKKEVTKLINKLVGHSTFTPIKRLSKELAGEPKNGNAERIDIRHRESA